MLMSGYKHLQHTILSTLFAGFIPPGCTRTLYAWAPGSETFALPSNVHIQLGSGTAKKSVLLEVHYNNVDGVTNETDSTAMMVWHTDKPRTHGYDLCTHSFLHSDQNGVFVKSPEKK
jgi:hypothetical protein